MSENVYFRGFKNQHNSFAKIAFLVAFPTGEDAWKRQIEVPVIIQGVEWIDRSEDELEEYIDKHIKEALRDFEGAGPFRKLNSDELLLCGLAPTEDVLGE